MQKKELKSRDLSCLSISLPILLVLSMLAHFAFALDHARSRDTGDEIISGGLGLVFAVISAITFLAVLGYTMKGCLGRIIIIVIYIAFWLLLSNAGLLY